MVLGTRRGLALVLALGVVGTGLVVAGVSAAGYGTLASATWIAGYGAMVVVLWYGWLRPLEFGPGGQGTDADAGLEGADQPGGRDHSGDR